MCASSPRTDTACRVVVLCLDGFNYHAVSPELTPHLWQLGHEGGLAPDGGRTDLPSVTYVSHATLATGTFPGTHGLTSNLAAAPIPGVCPGWAGEAQVRVPTLFDALAGAGRGAAAIFGDQHLVRIMGAERADYVWPAGGFLPETTPVCASGYATNDAVRELVADAVEHFDGALVFGHLNETDTWGHLVGPDHPDTRRAYAAVDAIVGEISDRLRPRWRQHVLIVISDHGMEEVRDSGPIDLLATTETRHFIEAVVPEGSIALARVRVGVTDTDAGVHLARIPEVSDWQLLRPGVLLVTADPGNRFAGEGAKAVRGVHGGPGAAHTLALVAGGHPAVSQIAAAIETRPPHLADWAPTIAALLDVPFPDAEGRNLLA